MVLMLKVRFCPIATVWRAAGVVVITGAQEKAVAYAKIRKTFGKPIAEHQTIQNMLAQNAIEIYTCKLMGHDLAKKLDAGNQVSGEHAMADAFVFDACYKILDRCMQVFGGIGMTNATDFPEAWKILRIARLSEGPTEIQMRMVARELLAGRLRL